MALSDPMGTYKDVLDNSGVPWAISPKNGKVKLFVGDLLTAAWPKEGLDKDGHHFKNIGAQIHRNVALVKAKRAGIIVPDGAAVGGLVRPQPGRPNPALKTPDDPIEGRFVPQPRK